MADYTVSVNITARDTASSAISNVSSALSTLSTTASGTVSTNLNTLSGHASSLASGMVTLSSGVNSAISNIQGLMGSEIVQGAIEMVNLGLQVRSTTAAFEALAGTDAAATLELMREATSGVASDFQLMQAANRYFQLGIAQTGTEAAELVDIAITLGRVMGQDVTESIEAFGALLANQSIPRLDNFGISSSNVRARVLELKEAGMGAQEAFTMAVLEQGRNSLERLGDAADVGATNVDRLSVRWQNFFNTFAEGIAGVADQAAGTLEMIANAIDAQAQLNAINNGEGIIVHDGVASWDQSDPNYGNPLLDSGGGGGQFGSGDNIGPSATTDVADPYAGMIGGSGPVPMYDTIVMYQNWMAAGGMDGLIADANAFAAGMEESESALNVMAATVSSLDFHVLDGAAIAAGLTADGWDKASGSITAALVSAQGMYDLGLVRGQTNITGETTARGDIDGQLLFTPEEAQYAADIATYYNNLLLDAQALHEQGLISDAELANVQSTADEAGRLADEAERGAAAFENMTLSQAFGQTSGGMQGEVGGDVISYMREQGYSEDEIAAYQRSLQLETGQQTASSITYQDQIVPMIADIIATYGAEAGAAAIASLTTGMQTGQAAGWSDGQIAGNMASMTGFTYAHTAEEDQLMAEGQWLGGGTLTSTTPEEVDPAVQVAETVASSMAAAEASTDAIKAGFEEVETTVNTIATRLGSLSGRSVTMTVNLNTGTMPSWLRELIGQSNRDNGGTSAGTREARTGEGER